MKYNRIIEGRFVKRLNRFIAEVAIEGYVELVHVKNTGRCKELFIKGTIVYLEKSDNPNRKTKFSLISIYKGNALINIDSQVPNAVVFEALLEGKIDMIPKVTYAKREVTYGKSRFDIYYETEEKKGFIEVKGVTLEEEGLALFPDAPTIRGSKHIVELTKGISEGYTNYVFFLIQMAGISHFRPHHERDINLADNLYNGIEKGLNVLVYNSIVTKTEIYLDQKIDLLPKLY